VTDPWIGKLVGGCRIESKIGEGGCGQVYRGVDVMLERPVAIKVLHPALAARSDVAERFRSEALTLARFGHPNIGTLYSFHRLADTYVMVMEFIEGETFEELLQRGGPMSVATALPLLLQALDGIEHAHRHGVIHRDLKATNLMVNRAGIVKVMDFGIARANHAEGVTQANQPIGTPEYMSPEQVRGEELDGRSDLYASGVLLYKMLTGRLPIRGASPFAVMQAQVGAEPRPLRERVPEIPEALEALVHRALAKNRADRFASAAAFRSALAAAGTDADGVTLPAPPALPTPLDLPDNVSAEASRSTYSEEGTAPTRIILEDDDALVERPFSSNTLLARAVATAAVATAIALLWLGEGPRETDAAPVTPEPAVAFSFEEPLWSEVPDEASRLAGAEEEGASAAPLDPPGQAEEESEANRVGEGSTVATDTEAAPPEPVRALAAAERPKPRRSPARAARTPVPVVAPTPEPPSAPETGWVIRR